MLSFNQQKHMINHGDSLQKFYILFDTGEYQKLSIKLRKATKAFSDNYFFWYLYAQTEAKLGKHKSAESLYSKALKLDPKNLNLISDLSRFFREIGQLDKALKCANKYKELAPNSPEGFRLAGQAFLSLNENDRAEASFQVALELNPDDQNVLKSFGKLYIELGKFDAAIAFLEPLFAKSQTDIELGNNLALAYMKANKLERASEVAKVTQKNLDHDIGSATWSQLNFNYSLMLLSSGECQAGWPRYLDRFEAPGFTSDWRNYKIPRLQNVDQARDKSILIWPEQGIGDQLLFYSLIGHFSKVSKSKIFCLSDPRLISVLQRSFSNIEFIEDTVALSKTLKADFHLPLGDLGPLLEFNLTKSDLAAPYIRANEEMESYWARVLSRKKLKVGLGWQSEYRTNERDLFYTNLNDWRSLISDEDIQVVNLQHGLNTDKFSQNELYLFDNMFDPNFDLKNDFENLSALLKNLDVVVAPASAILNFADACNVPNISYSPYVFWASLGNVFGNRYIRIPWLTNNKVYLFDELDKRQILDEIISEVRALVPV